MGTSLSYNTVNCDSDKLRRDAMTFILSLAERREWWAETMILFQVDEAPHQIYGDTKLFCIGIDDDAADCFMAMKDAEFILEVLELSSKQFGLNWEILLASSPAGGVVAGERNAEAVGLLEIFEQIAEAEVVDFSRYERQALLERYKDR